MIVRALTSMSSIQENTMPTTVVNSRKFPFDVFVGRPSKYGNPFSAKKSKFEVEKCATAEEAVAKFERWFLNQEDLVALARAELKNKVLGCFCDPQEPCHGRVIARIVDED